MLPDAERFRLLHGPYRSPRTRIGRTLNCEVRGALRVAAISPGRIPWPMARQANGGRLMLIVCGDLARAVRTESAQAIRYWWGVGSNTVWEWRKALGVVQNNAGTKRLRSKWWTDGGTGEAAEPGRMASLKSPERSAKIAAARRGKPRPPHVVEAMRKGRTGKPHTEEVRAKMREAHRARKASHESAPPGSPDLEAVPARESRRRLSAG